MENKKNNKNWIILIIVIICILSIISVVFLRKNFNNSELGNKVLVSECYKYSEEGEIKEYLCNEKAVNVPNKINDIQISSIGYAAFSNKEITGVIIPETITNIDADAFRFTQIENILIESKNITVDWTALSSINSYKNINIYYVGDINFIKTESDCSINDNEATCFNYYSSKEIIFELKKISNIINKDVLIKPTIQSNIVYGKSVDTVAVSQETINIKGYKEIIDSIDYISGIIRTDKISDSGTYDITFENLFGVLIESNEKITATIKLDETKTKEYILNNVDIIGLDSEYKVNIEQNEFKVIVEGTEQHLSTLNINDIKLYVDLTYLTEGTHEVAIYTKINNDLLFGTTKEVKVKVKIMKK